ncbi:MAG: RluA family pseudouridine synthase [Chitinivibrionales bacterium]|nr:RluA family pseudouridine synthase [Chitinivibrionales bacterium]
MMQVCVEKSMDGVRIDKFLRSTLASVPLSVIYRSIRQGKITINGSVVQAQNHRVAEGDLIVVIGMSASDEQPKHDAHPFDAVKRLVTTPFFKQNFIRMYEDEEIVVCNKPYGLVVHSGTGHGKRDTLIDLATAYLLNTASKNSSFELPQLVHRLDKDTSGVILLAKNKKILRFFHESLRTHQMEKLYTAICHNIPNTRKGTIELNLVKVSNRNQGMKMRVSDEGMTASSSYQVVQKMKSSCLVELELHTGKTHQLRVSCSHISCPIIGDERYGDPEADRHLFAAGDTAHRLYLHATQLGFYHPGLKRIVSFRSQLPAEFTHLIKLLS